MILAAKESSKRFSWLAVNLEYSRLDYSKPSGNMNPQDFKFM